MVIKSVEAARAVFVYQKSGMGGKTEGMGGEANTGGKSSVLLFCVLLFCVLSLLSIVLSWLFRFRLILF